VLQTARPPLSSTRPSPPSWQTAGKTSGTARSIELVASSGGGGAGAGAGLGGGGPTNDEYLSVAERAEATSLERLKEGAITVAMTQGVATGTAATLEDRDKVRHAQRRKRLACS